MKEHDSIKKKMYYVCGQNVDSCKVCFFHGCCDDEDTLESEKE